MNPVTFKRITYVIWFHKLKMLKGCGGFPLALEVIGGSLRGKPAEVQLSRLRKWSNDDIISNPDLRKCLQRSLEFSDPKVKFKECFTDLGSFPEDQRTFAAALIDMWALMLLPLYRNSTIGIWLVL